MKCPPFCCERCKLLDFGAWANEEYSVPAEEIAPALEDSDHNAPSADEDTDRLPVH